MRITGWKKYFNQYLWNILWKFMLIPLVLFLILIPISTKVIRNMKGSMVLSAERDLNASFQELNEEFLRMVQQAQIIGQEINIAQITRISDAEFVSRKPQNCYTMYLAHQYMEQRLLQTDIAANCYIISESNDIFLSGSIASPASSQIYGSFYAIEGYSYEEWRGAVLNSTQNYFFLPAANANSVFDPAQLGARESSLHLVIPISYSGASTGKAFVYILKAGEIFPASGWTVTIREASLVCWTRTALSLPALFMKTGIWRIFRRRMSWRGRITAIRRGFRYSPARRGFRWSWGFPTSISTN